MALYEIASRTWGPYDLSASLSPILTTWQAFHDMLIGVGLTEVTSDTGRAADFTTTTFTGTASATLGEVYQTPFKMYRFADTAQATRPFYLKLEFGSYSASAVNNARYASFRWSVGFGTNGSGTLTGTGFVGVWHSTRFSVSTAGAMAANMAPDGAGIAIIGTSGAQQHMTSWCIERGRNTDGTIDSSRLFLAYVTQIANNHSFHNMSASGVSSQIVNSGNPVVLFAPPSSLGTTGILSYEGGTGASPIYPYSYKPYPGLMCLMYYGQTDVGLGVTFSVTRYGVSRSYKTYGVVNNTSNPQIAANNAGAALIL